MPTFDFGRYENGEPYVRFVAQGVPLEANYWNSALYTHGHETHIDHLFIEMEQVIDPRDAERYQTLGAFIWRQATSEFDDLVHTLVENDFVHIHRPYPVKCDVDTYAQTGLEPPEVKVIVEEEDDQVVAEAMANIDQEIDYFLGESDE